MGQFVWATVAFVSGAGAVVSGGYGNHEFMAIAAVLVIVALIGAVISRISHFDFDRDRDPRKD